MPMGLSTRAVGAPIGTAGAFSPAQRTMRVVPLSAFFLDNAGEDEQDGENALVGFKRKKKAARHGKDRQPRADDKANQQGSAGTAGGDADTASAAMSGKRQSTAGGATADAQGAEESVTMSGGTPLIAPGGATRAASFPGGASKLGATHATTGATGTGNVAQYPVPIGGRRRRRRRNREEGLGRWIRRLGEMAL